MAGSVNKWDLLICDYTNRGFSLPQISERYGISRSKARSIVKEAGKLRTRTEGVRLAAKSGRLGGGLRGKKREFTCSHKKAISEGKKVWGEKNAIGISHKTHGYVEYTRGPNKGRSVHVVLMENKIGRPLEPDECVHHIDGDKHNNELNNLALLTRSGHMRLHQREKRIARNGEIL